MTIHGFAQKLGRHDEESRTGSDLTTAMVAIRGCTACAPYMYGNPLWWAHQDSNLEPKHYECSALTD